MEHRVRNTCLTTVLLLFGIAFNSEAGAALPREVLGHVSAAYRVCAGDWPRGPSRVLFLESKNGTPFYVTSRNRKSAPRVSTCLALAAAVGFSFVPVIAVAHHHEGATSFAEKPGDPLQPDFEADCALCGQLNLNDGRSLGGPSALWLTPAQDIDANVIFAVLALPAAPDRAHPIRGPPSKA